MILPDVTIRIRPTNNVTVSTVAIKATWQSPDGTPRTIQQVVDVATLDDFLGDIVHEMFDTIKLTEEELNG